MHNAETVSRAIQVLNLDVCHWRAGCGESRTSGSEGGRRKSAPGNRGNSPAAYPTEEHGAVMPSRFSRPTTFSP